MLGPFATASRRTPIHKVSPVHRCPRRRRTTTTTTRDRGDRYGPMEWAQQMEEENLGKQSGSTWRMAAKMEMNV